MAELTLAILPLVISALEHYSTARTTLSRYRNFSVEVEEFRARLDVQCRIFQSSVQLLLASEVGNERAARLVQDENDSGWKDPDLDTNLTERFSGCTASATRNCLYLIQRQIEKLLEVRRPFQEMAEEVDQDGKLLLRQKARRMGKKIDLACSQGRIEMLLRSLREGTEDFRVLVQQTERLNERCAPEEPNRVAKAKVKRFAAVKSAAENLYAAFGQACTKHTEHQGYIGLHPTHNNSDHVNFVLAFKSLHIQSTPLAADPAGQDVVWLTIESKVAGSVHSPMSNGILNSLNRSAKRTLDASPSDTRRPAHLETRRKHKKTVSFQSEPLVDCPLSRPIWSQVGVPPVLLANLCMQKNFCNQMRKVFKQSKPPIGSCIGYLESNSSSKHLVYIHSRMDKITTTKDQHMMKTLSEVLKETSYPIQLGGPLSLHKTYYVCKQLALALLQFHETCWLKESWSSDDIMVSNVEEDSVSKSLQSYDSVGEPFANVSIRGQDVVAKQLAARPLPYVRNRAMFNLGKILLELAFQKPFHCLKRREDVDPDSTADSEDFFTAKRLLFSVSRELGERFAEVVRKCIECDFGEGDDLASERLQASFYQYVICELEICEQRARCV